MRIEIIFVRIEIFVLKFVVLLDFFVIVKPDGYPIPAQNLMGRYMGTKFYPRV
jgi:hypothetical protein